MLGFHSHLHTHADWRGSRQTHARILTVEEPPPFPMSGTDLGQSWLMCPQLPRGFWSGGSSACSLALHTNAECYCILLLHSTWEYIRITWRQCGGVPVIVHTLKCQSKLLSVCASCCVNTMSACLLWIYGCIWQVSRSWGTWDINTKQMKRKLCGFQMIRQLVHDTVPLQGSLLLMRQTAPMSLYL